MSRRRSTRAEESDFDLSDSVTECVRYIYCRESSKIPIKRADIQKHLAAVTHTPSNLVNSVIASANTALKMVYNYKLVQVASKAGIQYIVVSDREFPHAVPSPAADPQHRKLLVAALTHIFMTGGPVTEDDMFNFLQEAGLLEERDHATRKLLTNTFTRQLYLTYTKRDEGETGRSVFEWGQRAMEEVPKMFLLKKVAEAMKQPADHWCEQYREANANAES